MEEGGDLLGKRESHVSNSILRARQQTHRTFYSIRREKLTLHEELSSYMFSRIYISVLIHFSIVIY